MSGVGRSIWWFYVFTAMVMPAHLRADDKPTKQEIPFDKNRAFLKVIDFTMPNVGDSNRPEHETFCALLLHASRFEQADLDAAARKDVSYADLMVKSDALREDLRYELVRVKGRLRRLKNIGTFPELVSAKIPAVYEAWVFPENAIHPVCVFLTTLPAGLEPNLDYAPSLPVTVCGYFFKIAQYETLKPSAKNPERNQSQNAPVLMGQSLELRAVPESAASNLPPLLPAVIVCAGALLFGILGLIVYLRNSDRGLRRYEDYKRSAALNIEPIEPHSPSSTPPTPDFGEGRP